MDDLTSADYKAALEALTPSGRVWPRHGDAGLSRLLDGLAQAPTVLHRRADYLLDDAFPATAYELLAEWEESLGLPDPCAGEAPTLQQRRAQVVARFSAYGGQSVPYLVAFAASLGFTVTIREYAPARLGTMRMGDRMSGAAWAHVWAIRSPETTVIAFRLGQSGMGERFRTWGNDVLECEMRAVAPAHTILLFQYI